MSQRDAAFRRLVLAHWRRHGRHDLPWRKTTDPYGILVSEIMLQQTQVDRVIPKFRAFLAEFPSFRALADAKPSDVLLLWQGLGYNRRALMLQKCSQAVMRDHAGTLPRQHEALCALPGIGPYTAGAIMAFAFDMPWPVIETNIRRVYIHHFFPKRTDVSDVDIARLVARHLAVVRSPRQWYSALMDYGSWLALSLPKGSNPNRKSRSYARQSKFEGSPRQLRGRLLKILLERRTLDTPTLASLVDGDTRTDAVLEGLAREGFVHKVRGKWHIL
jgi:A/G-specific adenine glycosylase